jgi:hypothetical protein
MNLSSVAGMSIALVVAVFLSHPAQAGRHHRHYHQYSAHRSLRNCTFTNDGRHYCGPGYRRPQAPALDANGNRAARIDRGTIIGGQPAGCPHAYCGCGLRKYLGLADKRLNLAWNWARLFPRASAHAGAAAVRHHHVMLLVRHVAGSRWLVRDYNGGRHLAWLHVRNVRGYIFVNPHALLANR